MTGAKVGGLPPFSLPRLGHSGEWVRTEPNIELVLFLLAQRDKTISGRYIKQTSRETKLQKAMKSGGHSAE